MNVLLTITIKKKNEVLLSLTNCLRLWPAEKTSPRAEITIHRKFGLETSLVIAFNKDSVILSEREFLKQIKEQV